MIKEWATRRTLILFLTAAIIVIIFAFQNQSRHQQLSQERLLELRREYPAYNEDPPFASMIRPSFEEIMDRSETVIIGEVVAELPEYTVDLVKPGTVDEQLEQKMKSKGLPSYQASFKQYEVKVTKQIAGEPVEDVIKLAYNADFAGFEPELKSGMSIVTGIAKGQDVHEGRYFFTRFGTYYVVEGRYVLSAVDDEFSKTINGHPLDVLIEHIVKIKES